MACRNWRTRPSDTLRFIASVLSKIAADDWSWESDAGREQLESLVGLLERSLDREHRS